MSLAGKPPGLPYRRGPIANHKSGMSKQALRKVLQFRRCGQCCIFPRLRDCVTVLPQGHVALLGSHIQINLLTRPGGAFRTPKGVRRPLR